MVDFELGISPNDGSSIKRLKYLNPNDYLNIYTDRKGELAGIANYSQTSRGGFQKGDIHRHEIECDGNPSVYCEQSVEEGAEHKNKMASSETGHVKPISMGGRMVRERERLLGMSNEERAWRKQYLKDFELEHGPRRVQALEMELMNPIRRFYRAPLDKLCDILTPSLGHQRAYAIRFWLGKAAIAATCVYAGAYYLKYNQNDWTRKGGWRVISSRRVCNPGSEGFPKLSERTQPSDYAARGFQQAPI